MKNKILTIAGAVVMIAGVVSFTSADAQPRSVRATLETADRTKIGFVDFKNERGYTEVKVRLTGAAAIQVNAFHGFHIHANDLEAAGVGCVADKNATADTWFMSADGHYNPTGASHSAHVGDMPVVFVNTDGSVETRFRIDRINSADLVGKVVILHDKPDNYANIPLGTSLTTYTRNDVLATQATNKTGNAGNRVACGVIEAR